MGEEEITDEELEMLEEAALQDIANKRFGGEEKIVIASPSYDPVMKIASILEKERGQVSLSVGDGDPIAFTIRNYLGTSDDHFDHVKDPLHLAKILITSRASSSLKFPPVTKNGTFESYLSGLAESLGARAGRLFDISERIVAVVPEDMMYPPKESIDRYQEHFFQGFSPETVAVSRVLAGILTGFEERLRYTEDYSQLMKLGFIALSAPSAKEGKAIIAQARDPATDLDHLVIETLFGCVDDKAALKGMSSHDAAMLYRSMLESRSGFMRYFGKEAASVKDAKAAADGLQDRIVKTFREKGLYLVGPEIYNREITAQQFNEDLKADRLTVFKDQDAGDDGLTDEYERLAKGRAATITAAKVDMPAYLEDFFNTLSGHLRFHVSPQDFKTDFDSVESFRDKIPELCVFVAEKIEGALRKDSGPMAGDIVKAVRTSVRDLDDDGKKIAAYYFGGTVADVRLGSEGEVLAVEGDRITVLFRPRNREYMEWFLRPDEIKVVKKGYLEYLKEFGGTPKAMAKETVNFTAETLLPQYIANAQNICARNYDTMLDDMKRKIKAVTDKRIGIGKVVRLVNLRNYPDLEGKVGIITDTDVRRDGKFQVYLFQNGGTHHLNEDKLRPLVPFGEGIAGTRLKVVSGNYDPVMPGHEGTVVYVRIDGDRRYLTVFPPVNDWNLNRPKHLFYYIHERDAKLLDKPDKQDTGLMKELQPVIDATMKGFQDIAARRQNLFGPALADLKALDVDDGSVAVLLRGILKMDNLPDEIREKRPKIAELLREAANDNLDIKAVKIFNEIAKRLGIYVMDYPILRTEQYDNLKANIVDYVVRYGFKKSQGNAKLLIRQPILHIPNGGDQRAYYAGIYEEGCREGNVHLYYKLIEHERICVEKRTCEGLRPLCGTVPLYADLFVRGMKVKVAPWSRVNYRGDDVGVLVDTIRYDDPLNMYGYVHWKDGDFEHCTHELMIAGLPDDAGKELVREYETIKEGIDRFRQEFGPQITGIVKEIEGPTDFETRLKDQCMQLVADLRDFQVPDAKIAEYFRYNYSQEQLQAVAKDLGILYDRR